MINKKLFILVGLILSAWSVFAIGYSSRPKNLYQTSTGTYTNMQVSISSPNHTPYRGPSNDDGDPDNWADPFSGSTPSDDPSDPNNWADPFGGGGGSDDPSDPSNWEDPFSHVPIGDIPWILIIFSMLGYALWKNRKAERTIE